MNDTSRTFLKTLYHLLDPNPDASLSMYDVDTAMDLGREESSQAAQQLMAAGLVDVRTLAGAIGITTDGLNNERRHAG